MAETLSFPIPRAAQSVEPPKELLELQQKCPMAKLKLFDGTLAWVATKHQDILDMLSSNVTSNASIVLVSRDVYLLIVQFTGTLQSKGLPGNSWWQQSII